MADEPLGDVQHEPRRHRRRQADRDQAERAEQLERDIRSFANHRFTRRIVAWGWPLVVAAGLAGYAKWKGLPTQEWQVRVEQHQRDEEASREAIRRQIALLEAEVKWNANQSAEHRKEMITRMDQLDARLERWFRRAGQ